jgi:hypothetical protein
VRLTPTPGSVFQLTGLIEGRFDIAETAVDNVIAYMEGQGEASVSVKPDLFVFMGGDSGLLSCRKSRLTRISRARRFRSMR